MALSEFPKHMNAAVSSTLKAAAILRHVRDARGDLTFGTVEQTQQALRQVKVDTVLALREGQKARNGAEAYMASVGGPATLGQYQQFAQQAQAAAVGWNDALEATLMQLTAAELIQLADFNRDGVSSRMLQFSAFIPAAKADPLRQSSALADLIAVFDAVGA